MKIGFLFPGQGAQYTNMGKDLYDNYPEYKEVYDRIKKLTNMDVEDITFNESKKDLLNQTKYTQPCILAMSLGILEILKKYELKADISAGLSLGEYAALIYSKALNFNDGIKLIQKRGEFMQNLCPTGEWGMAAILGLNEEEVNKVCKSTKTGFVTIANINSPGQIVISGEKLAVEEAINKAKEIGCKRAILLNTSGPFHTEKLEEASKALKIELETISFNAFETNVVKNIDGKIYSQSEDIKNILAKHIVSPVRFLNCIETMISQGVDTFIELGPGKTLSSLVKKINREVSTFNIQDILSLNSTLEILNK